MKEHKNHTKTFRELDFKEQALSINAQIINLERQFKAHHEMAEDFGKIPQEVKDKLILSALKLTTFAAKL